MAHSNREHNFLLSGHQYVYAARAEGKVEKEVSSGCRAMVDAVQANIFYERDRRFLKENGDDSGQDLLSWVRVSEVRRC